jgi:transposase
MGRIEILTGVERRRDWSDDEKLSILDEVAVGGAKIADVARRHDLKPQQIYTWRKKFAAEQAQPVVSFLPVALIASESSSEAERPASPDKPATAKRLTRHTCPCAGTWKGQDQDRPVVDLCSRRTSAWRHDTSGSVLLLQSGL